MERKKRSRIRRKNAGTKKMIIYIVLAFIIVLLIKMLVPKVVTLSRYVYQKVRSFYLISQEFYFNSDKLSIENSHFEASNWSGVSEYVVSINMNSRHNNIEASPIDEIKYSVVAEYEYYDSRGNKIANPENYIDVNVDGTATTSTSRSILKSNNNKDFFDIKVTPKTGVSLRNDEYVMIYVTATSTSPYVQTLTGEIKITVGNLGINYQIEDSVNEPSYTLRLTNTLGYYKVDQAVEGHAAGEQISISEYLALSDDDKEKCHSLSMQVEIDPNQVVFDTTDSVYLESRNEPTTTTSLIDSYSYVNKVSFKIEAEESRSLKFFKNDVTKNYTYLGNNVDVISIAEDTDSDGEEDKFTVKFYDKEKFEEESGTNEEDYVFMTMIYQ